MFANTSKKLQSKLRRYCEQTNRSQLTCMYVCKYVCVLVFLYACLFCAIGMRVCVCVYGVIAWL